MDLSILSVAAIRKIAENPEKLDEKFLAALTQDRRKGVQALLCRLKKDKETAAAEIRRLTKLFIYEDNITANGYHPVAGIDEAGRGPLAGPVLAAAVILPRDCALSGLNDSKKLTPRKRAVLAEQIKEVSINWSVAQASVEEIYRHNIFQAALTAMCRSVNQLQVQPAYVLVDGFRIDQLNIPQIPIIGGDNLSASIAAASILAKVERDALMDAYHAEYPEYGFNRHKGYGTAEHLSALVRYGPCPIHRMNFGPVRASSFTRDKRQ